MPDDIQTTDTQKQTILDKNVFPTSLRSDEIRFFWSKALKEQALFSARTTSKEYLDKVKELLADFQDQLGKTSDGVPISQGLERTRMLMREKLMELGLVEVDKNGKPVEKITNLGSTMRLNLIIRTNTALAHSMRQKLDVQDPLVKILRPYFELVRNETRKTPRNWYDRWLQCADKCKWNGVVKGTTRMIAKIDSPIWELLGSEFPDSIGVDMPPFCWNSGMGWKSVSKKEVKNLGLEVG